jgi:hypothetical protein
MSTALLVAGWTFPAAAQSGTSCVDAIPLNSSSCTNEIVTSTNEIWLIFNASSANQELTYTVTELGYSNYETMTVYGGSCTSLAVIAQGALSNLNEHIISLQCAGLTIGNTYWIQLQRTQALVGGNPNAKFNICIRSLSTVNAYWGGCLRDANGNVYYCCYDPDFIMWDYMATDCGVVDTFCVGDSLYLQHAITNQNYNMDSSYFAAWQFQGGSCAGTYIDTTFTSWA